MRVLFVGFRQIGAIKLLDKLAKRGQFACWLRSLFTLYDLPQLVLLDTTWWNYNASNEVEKFLASRSNPLVFEWGSGASTIWLSKRAAFVVAIEHDPQWAIQVRDMVPSNVKVQLVLPGPVNSVEAPVVSMKTGFEGLDFSEYVSIIETQNIVFDLIIIDGRAREACLHLALRHLKRDGMIVFDNVDRSRYRKSISAIESIININWTRGLTPGLPYPTRAALIAFALGGREGGCSDTK